MTNRPVMVERWTVVLLDVPRPIRSFEVVRGLRRAVEAFTKRPVRALLLAVRAMRLASVLGCGPLASTARGATRVGVLVRQLDTRP